MARRRRKTQKRHRLYETLRRRGMSKTMAAKIANPPTRRKRRRS